MIDAKKASKKYPLWELIKCALRDLRLQGNSMIVFLLTDMLFQIVGPFLLVLLPSMVIRQLEANIELSQLLLMIVVWTAILLVMNMVQKSMHIQLRFLAEKLVNVQYWRRINEHLLTGELTLLESSEGQEDIQTARYACYGTDGNANWSGVIGFYEYLIMAVVNIGGFLLYAMMAGNLSIFLFVVLLLLSVINCYVKLKSIDDQYKKMEPFWENNARFWYLKNTSIDMEKAKDIRMYSLIHWFKKAFGHNVEEAVSCYTKVNRSALWANEFAAMTVLIRDGFAYGYLIMQMMAGHLDVAGFLLYISIVAGFGTWLDNIVLSVGCLKQCSTKIAMMFEFVGEKPSETKVTVSLPAEIEEIRFEDISFGYGERKVFDHFSLTLKAHEKIALVGINGAGKTTLVKLLCGLYPLQGGRILVNGIDMADFTAPQRAQLIAILFQDVHVLPFSIAKNVACEAETLADKADNGIRHLFDQVDTMAIDEKLLDRTKVEACLKKAGLYEKVSQLPKGMDTSLTQILDKEGILLSGGQLQRLMLARALYRDTPVLILDEPTAALDPIAESELYEEYARLCEGKLSIFISHRLSSTRFCDRILFLENGQVVEEGTHEALMNKHGKYAQMYEVQAHYYQKEVAKREAGI